ncbi:MAG: bifunctional 2-C-methyl-D-erythritol 4-phosphate cytidylyltransferase/2-C-methyl-D-erythritol 2,4-cyclodiphosphate synthase [Rhizobiales bacterium]|nr:bifunctional 2-C-methyl-D-erythritol 4-phosphate cytidylyltransferase/2-C-methyl-D-erythritol 2,4-cyclodiphosphate synthase [Hyphomicrobiales bacterium]
MSVAAIVVAAGRGIRAGGATPKQYRTVAGDPVIRASLALFAAHAEVNLVQPVIHRDDRSLFSAACAGLELLPPANGGATRQASVWAGIEALAPHAPDIVLVHDAARPFASPMLVSRAIAAMADATAAIPGLDVSDTIKRVDAGGRVADTLDRTFLLTVQTPQAFQFAALRDAHLRALAAGRNDFTDDAALMEWCGAAVTAFPGEQGNVKLTTPDDFLRAESERMARLGDVRTGTGYDVHAFGDGDHVMLGGVRIPHERGLSGHSDADVALHAAVDAILGALADGDIGKHFPPSDPQWRGAASDIFLQDAVARVRSRGGIIAHLDISLVCEAPRIGPHRDAMRQRIAEIAGIDVGRVAVKATTSERLGFTGRGEGIVAMAAATIRLPWSLP